MKITDIIFALICGRIIGFLIGDFLKEWGIAIGLYYGLLLWLILPFLSLLCLWLAYKIGKKLLFVYQAAKHLLVGAAATVIDLKLFEFLLLFLSVAISSNPMILKGVSFLVSTGVKYWGNKFWAFGRHEHENWRQEFMHFFVITVLGLLLDVAAFYYFTHILGPQFSTTPAMWLKLSVIFAAVIAALWNFAGYKFLVFKK